MTTQIFVPGKPKGKGRPRLTTIGGHAHAYTPKTTAEYEEQILTAFIDKYGDFRYSEHEYLKMSVIAAMPIPSSFNKKEKQQALEQTLRPATRTSDLDNIVKSAMDGLQGDGKPIPDDKQIVEIFAVKIYSDEPGLTITIEKINLLQKIKKYGIIRSCIKPRLLIKNSKGDNEYDDEY